MKNIGTILSVIGASVALLLALPAARAQTSRNVVIPHSTWDCGMPDGIPSPETGDLAFELEIPLERVFDVGKTQYGMRRVAVGLDGSVKGPKLSGAVATGALDFELTLANGVVEIEQAFVLQLADGTYVFARNAGTGPNAQDVRVVMDFEAPNDSAYAWLSSGKFVARREVDAAGKAMRLRIYDVSKAAASSGRKVSITKPAGVPAQPWAYRAKGADEQQGEMLIVENVTLAPSQRVGDSKRGTRNIIPITGGTVSGRISGKVVRGGADYQLLTPPATIDAHYLWQADDGEVIVVRNGGAFGALVPTFEARVDGPYAYLNAGAYLSSNPGRGEGGVALSFYESTKTPPPNGP
ncbi:MAG TPA: DUF3237 family protein [Gammaproteobacteria bacterium]|nr:DUF3237 family protein [Gammaproteobacteria bacterium]